MADFILRLSALGIFACWTTYWLVTEKTADREKPKTRKLSFFHKDKIRKVVLRLVEGILLLQLFGLPLLQIKNASFKMQALGLFLVALGFGIAFFARKTLGTNWAHAFEYQVKQKQELVTSGIYKYIRHPIYTGLIVGLIGGELVAKSCLVFSALIIIVGAYYQAKLEEKLLLKHFGDKYKSYMAWTKMFIPYLW